MQAFIRAFKSEEIKISKIKVLLTIVILAILFTFPSIYSIISNLEELVGMQENITEILISNLLNSYSNTVFPIYIVAITTSLINTDFKNNGFKLVETQPLGKINIFLAKTAWTLITLAFFLLISILITLLIISILYLALNGYETLQWQIDFKQQCSNFTRLYVSSFAFIGFVTALMYLFKKPIIVNIASFIIIIVCLILFLQQKLPSFIPLYYTYNAASSSLRGNFFTPFEWASIIGFITFLVIAYQFYTHRNHRWSILKDIKSLIICTIALNIGAVLIFYILQPKSANKSAQTIITGKLTNIQSTSPSRLEIQILGNDSIINVPINNGSFTQVLSLQDEGMILVKFNNKDVQQLNMQANDSVHLAIKQVDTSFDIKITGTIAEDIYLSRYLYLLNGPNTAPEWLMQQAPNYAMDYMERLYTENYNKIKDVVTPDNYTFSKNKMIQIERTLKMNILDMKNNYIEKYKEKNPKQEEIIPTQFFINLENSITETDKQIWENKKRKQNALELNNNPEQ